MDIALNKLHVTKQLSAGIKILTENVTTIVQSCVLGCFELLTLMKSINGRLRSRN